jgi:hypothetical protein
MVFTSVIPATERQRWEESQFESRKRKMLVRSISINKLGIVIDNCDPS